jgi:hypothetical protein
MKRMIVLVALISCVGCTTLHPVEGTSTELQRRIISGALLKAGDRVVIVTTDNQSHRIAVTAVVAGLIKGTTDSVPVDQVASLKIRRFSRAKTLALIGGVVLVVGGVFVYVAAHAVPAIAL